MYMYVCICMCVILLFFALRAPARSLRQCVYDPEVGFTPERTAKLRGKFVPKYPVVSLNKQRWCRKTGWSDPGWCVFDNNFAARANDNDPGGQVNSARTQNRSEDWSYRLCTEQYSTTVQNCTVHEPVFQPHTNS